ncbi:MAG: DNA/RNA non-specific endonuclease [Alloprevotella sp.]|nr:DNA/RNA non-specific endonuclease [Alloprevotella sp.]
MNNIRKLILLLSAVIVASAAYAQEDYDLVVKKKDGTRITVPVADIDTIIFNEHKKDDTAPRYEHQIYFEDFAAGQGGFSFVDVSRSAGQTYVWRATSYGSNTYIYANAYFSNQSHACESWAVSPAFDLREATKSHVSFSHAINKLSDASRMKDFMTLWVSTDFTGSIEDATWTQVEIPTYPEGTSWTFVNSGIIDLSEFCGHDNVRFAFRYEAEADLCGGWEVTKVRLTANTPGGDEGEVSNAPATHRLEVPRLRSGSLFVDHWTFTGVNDSILTYCYEFDPAQVHNRWVAFRFDGQTRAQYVSRNDAFADDPDLPEELRIGTQTFSGYDRGHICASADRLYSEEANKQTFYMSNMSPQLKNFNTGIWSSLETKVQTLGRDASFADTLYVVKGGTIDEANVLTYLYRQSGLRIPVPKYYYMALLSVKRGQYKAIAFVLEHKVRDKSSASDIIASAVSINDLEAQTGIDFFPNLPDDIETEVQQQCNTSDWGY